MFDFDWDSFKTTNAVFALKDNCFGTLIADYKDLCEDPIGKEAVSDGIDTIPIIQSLIRESG